MDIPRTNGRFAPGAHANPNGRPRGAAGLARYVAEQTRDGRELVDRLLELSRDPRAPVRERMASTMALLDRAVGKPMQPSEIAVSGGVDVRALLALPPAQRLDALDAAIARRALPEPDEPDEPDEEPDAIG